MMAGREKVSGTICAKHPSDPAGQMVPDTFSRWRRRFKDWLGRPLCQALRQVQQEWRLSRRHRASARQARRLIAGRECVRLELGPCDRRLDGWIGIDLFFPEEADLALDLRRPLPLPDDSVDAIYGEHVLEHLAFPGELGDLLLECRRVLKPGGEFLASVPDAGKAYRLYAAGPAAFYAHKGWPVPPGDWVANPMDELNWHDRQGGDHKFMFDRQNLLDRLSEAGFADVAPRRFDPSLDRPQRRDESLYVRAVKPVANSHRAHGTAA